MRILERGAVPLAGGSTRGERLAALVSPEALRLAAAILFLSLYVPLLFMGEEHGKTNPFLYLVSHGDPALVEAVGDEREGAVLEGIFNLSSEAPPGYGGSGEAASAEQGLGLPGHTAPLLRGVAP